MLIKRLKIAPKLYQSRAWGTEKPKCESEVGKTNLYEYILDYKQ